MVTKDQSESGEWFQNPILIKDEEMSDKEEKDIESDSTEENNIEMDDDKSNDDRHRSDGGENSQTSKSNSQKTSYSSFDSSPGRNPQPKTPYYNIYDVHQSYQPQPFNRMNGDASHSTTLQNKNRKDQCSVGEDCFNVASLSSMRWCRYGEECWWKAYHCPFFHQNNQIQQQKSSEKYFRYSKHCEAGNGRISYQGGSCYNYNPMHYQPTNKIGAYAFYGLQQYDKGVSKTNYTGLASNGKGKKGFEFHHQRDGNGKGKGKGKGKDREYSSENYPRNGKGKGKGRGRECSFDYQQIKGKGKGKDRECFCDYNPKNGKGKGKDRENSWEYQTRKGKGKGREVFCDDYSRNGKGFQYSRYDEMAAHKDQRDNKSNSKSRW